MNSQPRDHRAILPGITTGLALAFLYAPLLVVVLFSFHETASLTLPFRGFSLQWYERVFADPEIGVALRRSVTVGVVTSLLTLVLGTAAAYGLTRSSSRLRGPLAMLFFLPLALPGLFLGIAMLSWFTQIGMQLSSTTIVIAHWVYAMPFFMILARIALERLDPMLEDAAADLGAGPATIFRRVTLPQVWPVLVSGAALVFMLSFDEFVITYFIAGSDQTLPLLVFAKLRRTIDPTINVVSTLLLAFSFALWVTAAFLATRGARRHRRPVAVLGGAP
ncbi:MAG: spermidine/putrescine transport system permease protein [Solirubrobacteraceae bacterium]|jgi:ABC-type spermidine/putrescine transport system permease subunit II|nr:spermidine/putrescine transport system permease protein [Solirubrobacteraceae bacterium]